MAAEAIAVLILVQETADTVTSVVKAINELAGLIGGFTKQKDHTPELIQCIEKAKREVIEEIQKAELEDRLNSLFTCADDWFNTLIKVVDLAEKEKAGADPKQIEANLRVFYASILGTIKDLNNIKYYFEGPRPKPKTPEMLSVYFLCYSLRHSFVLAGEAIYAKLNGTISPNFASGIEDLDESANKMTEFITEYKNFRKGQIYYKEIVEREPGFVFHTGEYKIISDVGGDGAIGNLTNKTWQWHPQNGYNIGDRIIDNFWFSSNFGGQEVRLVYTKWADLIIEAKETSRSLYIRTKQK